jgi:hypothetical protein
MIKLKAFVILTLVFSGCRSNKEERVLKGEEYYPIQIGSVRNYLVDTILFNSFKPSIDTIKTEFREEVVERIVHGFGDTSYRIELSTWDTGKLAWVAVKSFERRIDNNYALEKINNREEVKMLFPIAEYKTKGSSYTWNANMFNNGEPVIVKYSSVFRSYADPVTGNAYNNCVSIKLNKPQTGLVNNVREEVYATGVGLVYRFMDSTDYLMVPNHLSGVQIFVRLK